MYETAGMIAEHSVSRNRQDLPACRPTHTDTLSRSRQPPRVPEAHTVAARSMGTRRRSSQLSPARAFASDSVGLQALQDILGAGQRDRLLGRQTYAIYVGLAGLPERTGGGGVPPPVQAIRQTCGYGK
jgi:hypothetical protein